MARGRALWLEKNMKKASTLTTEQVFEHAVVDVVDKRLRRLRKERVVGPVSREGHCVDWTATHLSSTRAGSSNTVVIETTKETEPKPPPKNAQSPAGGQGKGKSKCMGNGKRGQIHVDSSKGKSK